MQPTEFIAPRITSGVPMLSSSKRCGSSTPDPEVPAVIHSSENSAKPMPKRSFSAVVRRRPVSGAISSDGMAAATADSSLSDMIIPFSYCFAAGLTPLAGFMARPASGRIRFTAPRPGGAFRQSVRSVRGRAVPPLRWRRSARSRRVPRPFRRSSKPRRPCRTG